MHAIRCSHMPIWQRETQADDYMQRRTPLDMLGNEIGKAVLPNH